MKKLVYVEAFGLKHGLGFWLDNFNNYFREPEYATNFIAVNYNDNKVYNFVMKDNEVVTKVNKVLTIDYVKANFKAVTD